MIRWTERADSLRLEYSHGLRSTLWGCFGVVQAVLAAVCLVLIVAVLKSKHEVVCILPLFLTALFGVAASLCFDLMRSLSSWRGWVEIAIRGHAARWGGPGHAEMRDRVPVERFYLRLDDDGSASLLAVLPGGEQVPVLGPWNWRLQEEVVRLAEELNANLGEIDDPRTAAPVDQA